MAQDGFRPLRGTMLGTNGIWDLDRQGYSTVSQAAGLVMTLFASIFAVFIQMLDCKPRDPQIWNAARVLAYIGIVMNASGTFTSFFIILAASANPQIANLHRNNLILLAFAWMSFCLTLNSSLFFAMVGTWIWSNEGEYLNVAISSTVFLVLASLPLLIAVLVYVVPLVASLAVEIAVIVVRVVGGIVYCCGCCCCMIVVLLVY